ncbi:MAG: glutathione S-transferase [Methylovulum sp.]
MTKLTLAAKQPPPIFYSFRRCPYAMRARMAIASAGIIVELREIELCHKPEQMLTVSPKGTVPVLLLQNGEVIDESLDIMYWALRQNDPEHWLESRRRQNTESLILRNDGEFKICLDRYKYADRYPEYPRIYYRQQAELFLTKLERRLTQSRFLCGDHFAFADATIAPFIRQFAAVDSDWFENSPYLALNQWLKAFLASGLFTAVMMKYQPWMPGDPLLFFGSETVQGI